MHTHNCKHTAQIQRQFIHAKGIRSLWLIFCHFHKRDKFYEYLFAFLHTKTRLKEKNSLPRTTNYSWLSLSRTRLSRITAYLEVKIWSLPKREHLTTGKKYCGKEEKLLLAISPLFHNIFNTYISNFKSPITYIFVNCSCSNNFFLSSANLICRGTDISKYLIESLGIRDNESRLYFHLK